MHTNLLTQADLQNLGVVRTSRSPKPAARGFGWRSTSYDAQVGTIITKTGIHPKACYTLKPREIVWVVSDEYYNMPNNITGMTTNKTTLTKKGILALTIGIVDPGYSGPLSTALINFSGSDFTVHEGMEFFRTSFFKHEKTNPTCVKFTKEQYIAEIQKMTASFSESFLSMESLSIEMQEKIMGLPRTGFKVATAGIIIAALALLLPPLWQIKENIFLSSSRIELIEQRIEFLENQ